MTLDDVRTLPIRIWLAAVATVMVAGIAGIEVRGWEAHVPHRLHLPFLGVAFALYAMAWRSAEREKDRQLERQRLDQELRREKIEAGLDPSKDKTVIRE